MNSFSASLYDGQTSERRAVNVQLGLSGYLVVQELGALSRYKLDSLSIPEQLGNQPARISLPNGAMLEVKDSAAFYAALELGTGRKQWLHHLESRWGWVAISFLIMAGFVWGSYTWGIPALAKNVAYALPLEMDLKIGEEGLGILDERVFQESELDYMEQLRLLTIFMSVVEVVGEGDAYRYQLEFRKGGKVGPNAFALPAGIVVITDELVELAQNDDEIAAIMAHEVGHIRSRHALRALLQNSVVAGLIISLTGDPSSAARLAAGVPTLLARAAYSREFEYEADAVAREYLLTAGIPLSRFSDIILRMDESRSDRPGAMSLLDTHPEAEDRARNFDKPSASMPEA